MKKIILGILLLAMFACTEYTSRDVILTWDTTKGRAFLNGTELHGGNHVESFSLDTESVVIDFIADESDGWYTVGCDVTAGWLGYTSHYFGFPHTLNLFDGENEVEFDHRRSFVNGLKVNGDNFYAVFNYPYALKRAEEYYSYNRVTDVYSQVSKSIYDAADDSLQPNANRNGLDYRIVNTSVIAINDSIEKVLADDFVNTYYVDYSLNEDGKKGLFVVANYDNTFRIFVWDFILDSVQEVSITFDSMSGFEFKESYDAAVLRNNYVYLDYYSNQYIEGSDFLEWVNGFEIFAKIDVDTMVKTELYRSDNLNVLNYFFTNNYYYTIEGSDQIKFYTYTDELVYSDTYLDYSLGYDDTMDAVFYSISDGSYYLAYKEEGRTPVNIFEFDRLK